MTEEFLSPALPSWLKSRSRSSTVSLPVPSGPSCPSSLLAPFSTQPEVRLFSSRSDRFLADNQADLFSILLVTEHLETAYVRDSVSNQDYSRACTKLIAQYRTAKEALASHVPDVEAFASSFLLQTPAAIKRLEKIGVPATVEHGDRKGDKRQDVSVAATVHHFITTMDLLKLGGLAVDELQPHVADLMESLGNVETIEPEHLAKVRVRSWLVVLNGMKASQELQEEQGRQMLFELDASYNAFLKSLEKEKVFGQEF